MRPPRLIVEAKTLPYARAKEVWAELASRGIPVLRVQSGLGQLLVAAAEAGWPDVPAPDTGRELARCFAAGRTVRGLAEATGLWPTCVREMVRVYLEHAVPAG